MCDDRIPAEGMPLDSSHCGRRHGFRKEEKRNPGHPTSTSSTAKQSRTFPVAMSMATEESVPIMSVIMLALSGLITPMRGST
jgi:hypothetical protein